MIVDGLLFNHKAAAGEEVYLGEGVVERDVGGCAVGEMERRREGGVRDEGENL